MAKSRSRCRLETEAYSGAQGRRTRRRGTDEIPNCHIGALCAVRIPFGLRMLEGIQACRRTAAEDAGSGIHQQYADLTNRLAQCEAETANIKKEAISTIRARILKEKSAKKGDLTK